MSRSRIRILTIALAILVVLLLVGTFMDMDISERLFSEGNVLDAMGGFVGKVPAFLLLVVAFSILYNYLKVNRTIYKKAVYVLLSIAYLGCILLAYLLMYYSAFEEVTDKAKYIAVALASVSFIITAICIHKVDFKYLEELKKWALLSIIAVVIIILLTTVIKEVFGRARYIEILREGKAFTPWYKPNGFTGGHSFPSGHTALFGAMYMFIPLLGIFKRKGEELCTAGIFALQLFVGLSRILGGHHFLSDITMSMLISFVTCFVVTRVGYDRDYSNVTLSENNVFRRI